MRAMKWTRWVVVGAATLAVTAGTVGGGEVVRLVVADTIQPASQRFIERALAEAELEAAALVVMELDTPGGLLDTTREISTAITRRSVPVAVLRRAGGRARGVGRLLHPDVRRRRGDGAGHQYRRRPPE